MKTQRDLVQMRLSYELSIINHYYKIHYVIFLIAEKANEYLRKLKLVLDEIRTNLQNMEIENLKNRLYYRPRKK